MIFMPVAEAPLATGQDRQTGHRFNPAALLLFVVLFGLAAIFTEQLHLDWALNPSYSYGWIVPPLTAALFWMAWTTRPAAIGPSHNVLAVALVVLGAGCLLPLRIIAKANPDWRLTSWTLAFILAGLALAVLFVRGGWRWVRHFAFAVLFCLVAVPWPARFEQSVVQHLMRFVTAVNVELLTACNVTALQHGNVIELAAGQLGVEDACSGIRSLQSTFMLTLFLGAFYRLGWLRHLVLIFLGAIAAVVFNLGRTFFLAWMVNRDGMSAVEHWHDTAGWTVMIGCLVAVWGFSVWLQLPSPAPKETTGDQARPWPATARYLVVALGCWLVVAEVSSELWFIIRGRNVASAPAWTIEWPQSRQLQEIAIPKFAADLLHYNEGRGVAWQDETGKHWNLFFFKWLPGRTAALSVKVHRPEICLPASGFTALGEPRPKLLRVKGVALPARAYRFSDSSQILHVYYCYWDGTIFHNTREMIEEDWTIKGRLHRAWNGIRDRGAQTLEVAVWGAGDDEAAADATVEEELSHFVTG